MFNLYVFVSESRRVCKKAMAPLLRKVNKVVLLRFTEEHWPEFSKHLDINAVSNVLSHVLGHIYKSFLFKMGKERNFNIEPPDILCLLFNGEQDT